MTTIGNILFPGAAAPQGPWQDAGTAPAAGSLPDFLPTLLAETPPRDGQLPLHAQKENPAALQEKLAALLQKQPDAARNAELTNLLETLVQRLSARLQAEPLPAQILPLAQMPKADFAPLPLPSLEELAAQPLIPASLVPKNPEIKISEAEVPSVHAQVPTEDMDLPVMDEPVPVSEDTPRETSAAPQALPTVTIMEEPLQEPQTALPTMEKLPPETMPATKQAETDTKTVAPQKAEAAEAPETSTSAPDTPELPETATLENPPAGETPEIRQAPEFTESVAIQETLEAAALETTGTVEAAETPETEKTEAAHKADKTDKVPARQADTVETPKAPAPKPLPETASATAVDVLKSLIENLKTQDPKAPPAPGLMKKIAETLQEIDTQAIVATPVRPAALTRDLSAEMAPTLQTAPEVEHQIAEMLNALEPSAEDDAPVINTEITAPETEKTEIVETPVIKADAEQAPAVEADIVMTEAPEAEEAAHTSATKEADKAAPRPEIEIIQAEVPVMETPEIEVSKIEVPKAEEPIMTETVMMEDFAVTETTKAAPLESMSPKAEAPETETAKVETKPAHALYETITQDTEEAPFTRDDAAALPESEGTDVESVKTHVAILDTPATAPAPDTDMPAEPQADTIVTAVAAKAEPQPEPTGQETVAKDRMRQPPETRPQPLPEQAKAAEVPGQPAPAAAPAAFAAVEKTALTPEAKAEEQPVAEPEMSEPAAAPKQQAAPAPTPVSAPAPDTKAQEPAPQKPQAPQQAQAQQIKDLPQPQAPQTQAQQVAQHAPAQPQPQMPQQAQPAQPAPAHVSHVNMLAAQQDGGAQTGAGSQGQSGAQLFAKTAETASTGAQIETASAGVTSFANYVSAAQNSAAQPGPATQMVAVQLRTNAAARVDTMTIQIVPAELGQLDIRLKFDKDGSVKAHLTAEKPETLAMLRNDSGHLHRALQSAGFDTDDGSLTFDLRQDNPQHQGANGTHDQNARNSNGGGYGRGNAAQAPVIEAHIPIQAQGYISRTGVNIMV